MKTSIVGPVVGGVLGGIALAAILLLIVWFWRRKTRNAANEKHTQVHPFRMDAPDQGSGDLEAKERNQKNDVWDVVPFVEGMRSRSGEKDEVVVSGGSTDNSQTGLLQSQQRARNGATRAVIPSSKAREAGLILANPQSNTASFHHSGVQSPPNVVVGSGFVGVSSAGGSTPSPPISPSAGSGSGSGSGSHSRSQFQPRSPGDSPDVVQIPRSEVSGLREELQNLREAMQQMQHVGAGGEGGGSHRYRVSEAPPGYQPFGEGNQPWD